MTDKFRIVVAGAPRCGKTSLSKIFCYDIRHLDDLIDEGWSEASEKASYFFDDPGPWVIEGVSAVRALRKWLARNKTGRPCDALFMLTKPFEELTKGQAAMTKGIATVWREIEGEMRQRGVEVYDEPVL